MIREIPTEYHTDWLWLTLQEAIAEMHRDNTPENQAVAEYWGERMKACITGKEIAA